MTDQMTFTEICKIEPRVSLLYQGIKRHKGRRNWATWEMHKSQIKHLVGWEAISTDPSICNSQAYNVVYQTLWHEWS